MRGNDMESKMIYVIKKQDYTEDGAKNFYLDCIHTGRIFPIVTMIDSDTREQIDEQPLDVLFSDCFTIPTEHQLKRINELILSIPGDLTAYQLTFCNASPVPFSTVVWNGNKKKNIFLPSQVISLLEQIKSNINFHGSGE